MVERLMEAELLVQDVRAYIREHDHPIRDGAKLKLDYEAMVRRVRDWDGPRPTYTIRGERGV